jgi:hypothetical protein
MHGACSIYLTGSLPKEGVSFTYALSLSHSCYKKENNNKDLFPMFSPALPEELNLEYVLTKYIIKPLH